MSQDIQAEVYRIAFLVGAKLSEEYPTKSYLFDGEVIRIGGLSLSNQFHELAHWQVASPEMRREKDFGLGPGPETNNRYVKRKLSNKESDEQEQEASLLGIAYEAYFGLIFENTLCLHDWCSMNAYEEFWITISRLTEKGLLEGNLPKNL